MLALVYKYNIQPYNNELRQIFIFPEVVNLNNVITTEIRCNIQNVEDAVITLSPTTFIFRINTDNKDIQVTYVSADGKKYNRATDITDFINIGTSIQVTEDSWNDIISNFIYIDNSVFEGLYTYNNEWKLVLPLLEVNDYIKEQEEFLQIQQTLIQELYDLACIKSNVDTTLTKEEYNTALSLVNNILGEKNI